MADKLYRAYWAIEQRLLPGLRSSQYAYAEQLISLLDGKRWLDLGCGHHVFPDWMKVEQTQALGSAGRITGIDLDWEGLRKHPGIRDKVFGDLQRLPFAAGSFDVVSANMVVEHLEDPERILAEIKRVLTPGGVFLFHTPNLYHWGIVLARCVPDKLKKAIIGFLENRREEDVFPTHYRMNSAAVIRRLAKRSGFDVAVLKLVSGSATLAALGWGAIPELTYIRLIRAEKLAGLRSNLVVVLRKPS
jgi:SAM-dependent methyltransferase